MPPTLELRSKQHVALTPRLQQSVRLLQLSSLEFQHELRQALDNNPFLEYDDPVVEESEGTANPAREGDAAELQPGIAAETPQSAEPVDQYDGLSSSDTTTAAPADDPIGDFSQDWTTRSASRHNRDSDDNAPGAWAHAQPTMQEP
ncbi:MAG: RNA polymerase factor sigma-54, partial [Trinickia sp.]